MGSFTATTPPAKGASTATGGTGSAPATSHADQIQGAPAAPPPASAAPVTPAYTHADQIQGAVPLEDGILSGGHPEAITWPDPSASPWLNPPSPPVDFLNPFGGRGVPQPGESRAATPQLPPPPPLPSKPAPVPGTPAGLAGRTATSGQTPVYAPNEAEGGGNSAASAAYVQRKNADAAKIARTEAQVERRHDEAREKQRRAEQKAGERAARWHAEEMADAQKDATRRREQLAKTVATRVRQLMEPQGHPGMSGDAGIARAARHADLSAEAAASNERQVSALGKIRGVGDLPTYTADAAENYGEQGVHEVADLIHRTAKADPEQGKALLEQTTARISAAKADRLKATVASLGLDDEPGTKPAPSTPERKQLTQRVEAAHDMTARLEERMGPGAFKNPKTFRETAQELRDLLPRDGRERQLLEEAMYETSLGNVDAGREKLSELRRNLADPALPEKLGELEAAHGNDTRAERRERYRRRGDALDDLADLADETTNADRMLQQNRDAKETWAHDPRTEDNPHLSERRDTTRAEIDRDIARLEGEVETKLSDMGEKFLELKLNPGARHPDIDTDEAAWQKRIEEMDHPVIEALDIASDLSLGIAGKATKTVGKRLVKWAVRAGMTKDAVQGFQNGIDDASRAVLRNAGVDPAKPNAVRAWLDKDPLNRQKLMQAGVEAMAQSLAIGKAAGKLTGGIDGPKGAAAEIAAKKVLGKIRIIDER